MKSRRTVEDEVVELPEGIKLEEVGINGETYDLKIQNERDGGLTFEFYKEGDMEYKMRIREEGIQFERYVHRPNHDHDDSESLQIVTDVKKAYRKVEGQLYWSKDFPFKDRGCDFFKVPFGSRLDELP